MQIKIFALETGRTRSRHIDFDGTSNRTGCVSFNGERYVEGAHPSMNCREEITATRQISSSVLRPRICKPNNIHVRDSHDNSIHLKHHTCDCSRLITPVFDKVRDLRLSGTKVPSFVIRNNFKYPVSIPEESKSQRQSAKVL